MKISVIIPTYNGLNKIQRLLESLKNQTLIPDEIIIVIDGSTDGTHDFCLDYIHNFPKLIFINQSNKGRSITRNIGADHASHDLLIFIDDDMILDQHFISSHFLHHSTLSNSLATGPQINMVSNFAFDKFRNMLSKRWTTELLNYDNIPLPSNITYLTAANFSILKCDFIKLHGFDNQLKDAEDFDLAYRAKLLNYNIFYLNKALAWHFDNINFTGYIKRIREYNLSHRFLVNLKPNIYLHHPNLSYYPPKFPKNLVFYFFSNIFFIKLMENKLFLFLLPQFILNKLFDLILTANGTVYPDKVKL